MNTDRLVKVSEAMRRREYLCLRFFVLSDIEQLFICPSERFIEVSYNVLRVENREIFVWFKTIK
jgi:hypothetical protein